MGNPNDDTSRLLSLIDNALKNSTINKTTKKIIKDEITPWVNQNLQKLILYKRKLLKLRKKNTNVDVEKVLRRISNVIKKARRDSMNNYYSDELAIVQHDPKKSWRFINKSLGRITNTTYNIKNVNGDFITEDLEKAEYLNKYFLESVSKLKSELQLTSADNFNSLRSLVFYTGRFNFELTSYE